MPIRSPCAGRWRHGGGMAATFGGIWQRPACWRGWHRGALASFGPFCSQYWGWALRLFGIRWTKLWRLRRGQDHRCPWRVDRRRRGAGDRLCGDVAAAGREHCCRDVAHRCCASVAPCGRYRAGGAATPAAATRAFLCEQARGRNRTRPARSRVRRGPSILRTSTKPSGDRTEGGSGRRGQRGRRAFGRLPSAHRTNYAGAGSGRRAVQSDIAHRRRLLAPSGRQKVARRGELQRAISGWHCDTRDQYQHPERLLRGGGASRQAANLALARNRGGRGICGGGLPRVCRGRQSEAGEGLASHA